MTLEELLAALAAGTLELPTDVEVLTALRDAAVAEITPIQEAYAADGDISADQLEVLTALLDARDSVIAAIEALETGDADHAASVAAAMERLGTAATLTEDETEEVEAEVLEDEPSRELAAVGAGSGAGASKTPDKRPVSFRGKGPQKTEDVDDKIFEPGWTVTHGSPGFSAKDIGTKVGFAEMGRALDGVRKGHGVGRLTGKSVPGGRMRQSIAELRRGDAPQVETDQQLVEAIIKATDQRNLPNGSLIAAGGWCAPSEQIYTFCDVPDAVDLLSLPEITINRGGLRWPVEPDLTSIFEAFEFFFTEPELEAVDGDGNPTAFKHCVEIPCPDEFEEIRLNAVGYCVNAGILQRQGWPESITWFLQSLTQEHLRAMSRRSILDMWNGGGAPKVFSASWQVGATSGVLNAIALYAFNLRSHKGLARNATIEGVGPTWLFEALRADMAMMEGIDTKSVTDAQILAWFSARNIAMQWVGDWQSRDVNLPGNLGTLQWPGHVDIMLYPAGTWFRSLSNIIEVGVMYPKEQIQINRYTEFFTEDAIAIGKRCNVSANLRIPLSITGGYGAMVTITPPADTSPDLGSAFPNPDPVDQQLAGGQVDIPKTHSLVTTGVPTGGTFKLQVQGEKTATIAFGASAVNIHDAIVALDDAYDSLIEVGGGPLPTAVTIKVPSGWDFQITDKAFTGGTAPNATLS